MKNMAANFYERLKTIRLIGSGDKKPKKLYCYVTTDEKAYVDSNGKLYAVKKGAQ